MPHILLPESNTPLSWTDHPALLHIMKYQTGWWWDLQDSEVEKMCNLFTQHTDWNWNHTRPLLGDLSTVKKIVNVGSGIGVLDIAIHHCNPNIDLYLVDKNSIRITEPFKWYDTDPSYYNSWTVLDDLLTNTPNTDKSRFHTLDTVDPWPADVDIVLSRQAWCWIFPKEHYWERTLNSLKIGGKLIVDVLNLPNRDVVGEISEELGSEPTLGERHVPAEGHLWTDELTVVNGSHGGYYCWTRTR